MKAFRQEEAAQRRGGARQNLWICHVKAYQALHPGTSYREAMTAARPSYQKRARPRAESPKKLRDREAEELARLLLGDGSMYAGSIGQDIIDVLSSRYLAKKLKK